MNTNPTPADRPSDWYVGPKGSMRRPAIHTLIVVLASLISSVLVLLLAICTPGPVQAAEPGGYTVGVHVASRHFPGRTHLHDVNPGLYVVSPEGWVAGGYRNSLGRPSMYAGKVFTAGPASLTLGLISGYRRHLTIHETQCTDPAYTWCTRWDTGVKTAITGLVAPSVRLPVVAGVSARLTWLPSYGQLKSNALHLSIERAL